MFITGLLNLCVFYKKITPDTKVVKSVVRKRCWMAFAVLLRQSKNLSN